MDKKYYSAQTIFNASIMLFFGALFLIGTFSDKAIADFLYSPDSQAVKLATSVGVYPFFAASVFFLGALFERTVHSQKKKTVRYILCAACIVFAVFSGFIGGGAFLDRDCLGAVFPALNRNVPAISAAAVTGFYPMFFVGYRMAPKSADKALAKRIVCLLLIMLSAFVAMQVLKNVFHRPRYRTTVIGYGGIGFVPWYTPFSGASGYIAVLGISKGEFRSFPSGHSILSISVVYMIQSLTWFFPKLKEKALQLSTGGFFFGAFIMITRMILGAHYLTDVSAGAMIGITLSLVHILIQHRISLKQTAQSAEKASLPELIR